MSQYDVHVGKGTRGLGVVMKVISVGMPWMMPVGWRNRLPRAPWRASEVLPEGCPGHGTNKFTLLDAAVRGVRGLPAEEWSSETGRRQHLLGIHDPSGERRLLFSVGEGPTEAKQGRTREQSSTLSREQHPQRVRENPDNWCGDRRCKSGLHEPSCTKICTKHARLALGWLSVSSRPES